MKERPTDELDFVSARLPELDGTEESIRKYLAAVNKEVLRGFIEPRVAEALISSCRIQLTSLKQKADNSEVAELKAMLEEVRAVKQKGQLKVVSDRQHLNG